MVASTYTCLVEILHVFPFFLPLLSFLEVAPVVSFEHAKQEFENALEKASEKRSTAPVLDPQTRWPTGRMVDFIPKEEIAACYAALDLMKEAAATPEERSQVAAARRTCRALPILPRQNPVAALLDDMAIRFIRKPRIKRTMKYR